MRDRLLMLASLTIQMLGLMFIAYQTLRVVQIANEITRLVSNAPARTPLSW